MPPPESSKQQLKVSIDAEHAKCSICLNIWHDVVTIAPCLHNFCNGCFSEWLRRSQEKHSTVLCPQCRAAVLFVGRNHFLHSIEEDMLQADSSLKRSDEEVALLDSYASIKSNLIIQSGKKLSQKRARTSSDVEIDGEESGEFPCLQCGTEFNGFRCSPNMVHLQCQACGGMMPSRTDINVPQHCLGCDRAFCSAYWHAQGVQRSNSHMVCSNEDFKPVSQHTISRIPFLAHEKNQHEQDITERCIRQMGKTLQDVVSDWISKLNNREIDRTRMPLNHAEMITAGTHVCKYAKFPFLFYGSIVIIYFRCWKQRIAEDTIQNLDQQFNKIIILFLQIPQKAEQEIKKYTEFNIFRLNLLNHRMCFPRTIKITFTTSKPYDKISRNHPKPTDRQRKLCKTLKDQGVCLIDYANSLISCLLSHDMSNREVKTNDKSCQVLFCKTSF